MTDVAFAVVGGGPVGTLLAYDLGRRGHRVTLLDDSKPSLTRKAGSVNIRSMEHLRRFGLAEKVQEAFPRVEGHSLDIVFATGFAGYEIQRFERALGWAHTPYSNEMTQMIPQKTLCKVARREIEKRLPNVLLLDGARVTGLVRNDGVVEIAWQDQAGEAHQEVFDYLIGCDGGASTIRKQLGLKLEGQGSTARNLRILFAAPWLYERTTLRLSQQVWLVSDKTNASFSWGRGYNDNDWIGMTVWKVTPELEPEIRANPEAYVREVLGFDLPLDVISVDGWDTHNLVADGFRRNRVFLAGDAVHLNPPTGGLGLNTGIGDVADLGWKLSAVAEGWGGPALLDSYEAERRAAALRVVGQANHNYRSGAPADYYEPGIDLAGPEGEAKRARAKERIIREKQDEFYSPGLVLGTSYESSPVILSDEEAAPEATVVEYRPTARPGHRLPHSLVDGREPIFGALIEGINLVTVGDCDPVEIARATAAAKALNTPFRHVALGEEAHALYLGRFLLVRPDHYVAWRSEAPAEDWTRLLLAVTGRG